MALIFSRLAFKTMPSRPLVHPPILVVTVLFIGSIFPSVFAQDVAILESQRDNTLIEDATGSVSNGAAGSLYTGRVGSNGNETLRRAVIYFDLSSLPEDIDILKASLSVHVTLPERSNTVLFTLHRLTQGWGEGTSSFSGGKGAPATESDATWLHTFYEDYFWNTPGGDFIDEPSATIGLGGAGLYMIEASSEMLEDLSFWKDNPDQNFGWIIIGNESGPSFTVKQISSREARLPEHRPTVFIEYQDAGLPVALSRFDGIANGTTVHLAWETSSELNNAGFEVQHSFTGNFEKRGFVLGVGTTEEKQEYFYAVRDLHPGSHQFRLKQIDFDGTFAYSPTIEVHIENQESTLLNVYPSPFNPSTSILFYTQRDEYIEIHAYNALGKLVSIIHEGILTTGNQHRFLFEPSNLPSGLYWIRAKGATFSLTRSVLYMK